MNLVNTENNICIICYNNENYTIGCADRCCDTKICEECFETYLNYCLSEKILVKCLNQYCKYYIISNSFKKDSSYYNLYKKVLITAFINSQGSQVRDNINIMRMVDNLRKERVQFIKKFPKAIELVIDITLTAKLNKINKQNKLYIKEMLEDTNKLCMNTHCNGKLNKNFQCIKCETKFCKECEKIININHVCKQEDLDSLKLISSIQKCPNCNVPIEKSEGCNGMTCANCKTIFDYSTGILSDHGSHNAIISPLKNKIYFDYKQTYPEQIAKKLYQIEANEPKDPNTLSLNNAIKKIILKYENENISIDDMYVGEDILKTFENYLKSKINYINFINTTIYINELHAKDELTMYELDDIISKNGW